MMNITILGSAASAPTPQRSLPSIAVQIEGDVLLLDCGEGAQRQMMSFGVSFAKVKAIFVSHLHLDHFLGIFGLGETLRLSGVATKIDIFGPPGLEKFLYSFGHRELFVVHELHPRDCSSKKPIFTISNHDVFAFPAMHGKRMNAFGYLVREKDRLRFHEEKAKALGINGPLFSQIQKEGSLKIGKKKVKLSEVTYKQEGKSIAYSGDTVYSSELVRVCKNVDLLIHDCTFDEPRRALADEKFHSTATDAAQAAKKCNAKKLLLFHIGGRFSKDASPLVEEAKKTFENSDVAFDGMKLVV